MTNVDPIA